MTARIRSALTSIARPTITAAAVLAAVGALAASAGVSGGWWVYLAGIAVATLAVPAMWAVHHGRIGRGGHAAFAFLGGALVLVVPVIAMVAAFVNEAWPIHDALMPYAVTVLGMAGLFGTMLGLVAVGITIARAGVLPREAGILIAAAPLVDLPVELGALPLPVWGLAVVILATGFVLSARAISPRTASATATAAA